MSHHIFWRAFAGLGGLFILTTLYFLGGETLTDFALALIVGFLVGTYLSVFTAAPLAVAFDRRAPAGVPPEAARTSARETALSAREEPTAVAASTSSASSQRTTNRPQPARNRVGSAKREKERLMIPGRFTARSALGGCLGGLAALSLFGGLMMSVAEGIAYTAGLWLVFNVITTIGFGDGPQTGLGQVVAAGAFMAAAVCWFGIVSVGVEVGLSRFEHDSLVREALRPLAARRGPKLFHDN